MTKSLLKATGGATFTTHCVATVASVATVETTAEAKLESGSAVVDAVSARGERREYLNNPSTIGLCCVWLWTLEP